MEKAGVYDEQIRGEKMKKRKWMKRLAVGLLAGALCISNVAFAESEQAKAQLSYVSSSLFVDEDGISWFQNDLKILPQEGCLIGSTPNGPWQNDLSLTWNSEIPSEVYLMESGESGEPETVPITTLKRDREMPTAELSLSRGEETWNQIFSFITMDTFWKGGVTAEITASDAGSGVKTIEYFISDRDLTVEPNQGDELLPHKLERLVDGQWRAYNGPVSLREKATNVVYGKITDNVGNVRYVGSTGQNLYEDSQVLTEETVYYKGTAADNVIDVDLKGNTVASVSVDDTALTAETEYEITSDQVILQGSYLEHLDTGEYLVTIAFAPLGKTFDEYATGDAPAEGEVFLKVDVDTSDWGEEVIIADIPHYVQEDGTTSVKAAEHDIIWLKESSEGMTTWFGLDNTDGTFEKGSRFWVRILNENEDPAAWQDAYNQLDQSIKDAIEDEQVMLFEAGMTAVDGKVYGEFDSKTGLFVQIPAGWDEDDTEIVYVNEAAEVQFAESATTQSYAQGEGRFLTADLSHFSCYGIYDRLTEEEKTAQEEGNNPGQPGNGNEQDDNGMQPEGPAGGENQDSDKGTVEDTNEGNGKGEVGQTAGVDKDAADQETESEDAVPETGDHNNFFIWIIVGLAAARILAKLLRRKKNETNE